MEFHRLNFCFIPVRGSSKLSINKSARDYYLSSKDKIAGTTKLNKRMIRLKYIHVPTRVKNYVPSENEDIDVIHLVPGDFLIFLGGFLTVDSQQRIL